MSHSCFMFVKPRHSILWKSEMAILQQFVFKRTQFCKDQIFRLIPPPTPYIRDTICVQQNVGNVVVGVLGRNGVKSYIHSNSILLYNIIRLQIPSCRACGWCGQSGFLVGMQALTYTSYCVYYNWQNSSTYIRRSCGKKRIMFEPVLMR